MYLPKAKYSDPIYTRGDFLETEDGRPYTGWYFKTFSGDYYTGKEPLSTSAILLEQEGTGGDLNITKRFVSKKVKPTSDEYSEGVFKRYFVQDKRNTSIIEVNKEDYLYYINLSHLQGTTVDWDLTTPAENVQKGPYTYFGSESKNKESVLEAEKTINGLSEYIKDYKEFVE